MIVFDLHKAKRTKKKVIKPVGMGRGWSKIPNGKKGGYRKKKGKGWQYWYPEPKKPKKKAAKAKRKVPKKASKGVSAVRKELAAIENKIRSEKYEHLSAYAGGKWHHTGPEFTAAYRLRKWDRYSQPPFWLDLITF